MKYAFFEGQIVPFEEAKISVLTHAFNYGTGIFEGVRGYWNEKQKQLFLLKVPEHYERLKDSAKIMNIRIQQSVEALTELTIELARRNAYREDIYIRPLAYKSSRQIGVRLHNLEDDLTIFVTPFGDYLDTSIGIKCCVSSWKRLDDNMIPARGKITGSYVNSAFIKSEAMMNGFDEGIVLNHEGHVAEGSAENLFIVRDSRIITPPASDDILEGITRNTLMKLAQDDLGVEVIERSLDRTELYIADEVFLCGTGAQVSPVVEIDKRAVGDGKVGPITKKLSDLYFKAVRGENPKYSSWLIPVY